MKFQSHGEEEMVQLGMVDKAYNLRVQPMIGFRRNVQDADSNTVRNEDAL